MNCFRSDVNSGLNLQELFLSKIVYYVNTNCSENKLRDQKIQLI